MTYGITVFCTPRQALKLVVLVSLHAKTPCAAFIHIFQRPKDSNVNGRDHTRTHTENAGKMQIIDCFILFHIVSQTNTQKHTPFVIWGSFSVQRRSDYFSHCCCDKFKGALLLLWLLLLLLVLELLRLFPIHRSVPFEDSRWKCLESSQVAESQSFDSLHLHLEVLRHEFLLSWICTFAVHPKGMRDTTGTTNRNTSTSTCAKTKCEQIWLRRMDQWTWFDHVWPYLTNMPQHATLSWFVATWRMKLHSAKLLDSQNATMASCPSRNILDCILHTVFFKTSFQLLKNSLPNQRYQTN